jgi:hypothetical protein
MQGGPGRRRPGREVYMIRRLVAVLVILLLLILLVPRACGALFGSCEQPAPVVPEKTFVTSEQPAPVVPEKTLVTGEGTTNGAGETTEQGITSVSPP